MSIPVRFSLKVTEANDVHFEKTYPRIVVTLSGITIEVNEEQFSKAPLAIVVRLFERSTEASFEQP